MEIWQIHVIFLFGMKIFHFVELWLDGLIQTNINCSWIDHLIEFNTWNAQGSSNNELITLFC